MGDEVNPLQGSTSSGLVTLCGRSPPAVARSVDEAHITLLPMTWRVFFVSVLQLRVRYEREREEGGSRHRVQV